MREILFRGKRVDNGKWVEGWFVSFDGDYIMIKDEHPFSQSYIEVTPKTVCQFTGLTDKNGVKIFEGDIIKREDAYSEIIHTVEFYNGKFMATNTIRPDNHKWLSDNAVSYDLCFILSSKSKSEVIGNIHDNPELIK